MITFLQTLCLFHTADCSKYVPMRLSTTLSGYPPQRQPTDADNWERLANNRPTKSSQNTTNIYVSRYFKKKSQAGVHVDYIENFSKTFFLKRRTSTATTAEARTVHVDVHLKHLKCALFKRFTRVQAMFSYVTVLQKCGEKYSNQIFQRLRNPFIIIFSIQQKCCHIIMKLLILDNGHFKSVLLFKLLFRLSGFYSLGSKLKLRRFLLFNH